MSGGVHRFEAVGGLAHDLDVRLRLQDHAKAGAHHRLVVGDQDPDLLHRIGSSGSTALTRQPWSRPGPAYSSPP